MEPFSVGVVSGIIAAIIALVQLIVPNLLVVILVANLREDQTAVTWSVVSRALGNSLWPVLLRSDLATSRGVSMRVNLITWSTPLLLLLIAVAAVVTPIGLYQSIIPAKDTQLATFTYLADSGTMGVGTPPRSSLGFSRQCWGVVPQQCPGTTYVVTYSSDNTSINATIVNDDYDRRIPKVLANLYQSGLAQQPDSVSSYFDIQARHYQFENRDSIDNSSYLVDTFRALGSLVKDDDISLVDGLIVDMHNGRIGFRNHTGPSGLRYGAEWDEDILFFEPETVCVNMNMTLETQVNPQDYVYNSSQPTGYLVDQGGYVNVNKTSPYLDAWFEDLQDSLIKDGDPSLQARAYRAGWWTNVLDMYYFNVTKPGTNRSAYLTSEIGHRFPVNNTYTVTDKDKMVFGAYESLFSGLPSGFEWSNGTVTYTNYSLDGPPYWSNPFTISSLNYSDIEPLCGAALRGDFANLTNIAVKCGLILGPSRRVDGNETLVVQPGSWWTRPLYSCASTTKISIKNVHFRYNSSNHDGLKSLDVVSIKDKIYQNESAMPLWGVENANMTLRDLDPFWGLISPDLQHSVNLSVIRADHLYVPASTGSTWDIGLDGIGLDFNPGVGGPARIWSEVYKGYQSVDGVDYSGANDLALHSKWLDLSRNTTGTAKIANLIWTDYATNYFVGTRSWLQPRDQLPPNLQRRRKRDDTVDNSDASSAQVAVHVYELRIRYHWVYGIPAALCLAVSLAIFLAAAAAVLSRRASISRIRHYLWNLSAGRMLGSFLFPGQSVVQADTRTWIDQVGKRNVQIFETPGEPTKIGSGPQTYSALNQDETADATVVTGVEYGKVDSSATKARVSLS